MLVCSSRTAASAARASTWLAKASRLRRYTSRSGQICPPEFRPSCRAFSSAYRCPQDAQKEDRSFINDFKNACKFTPRSSKGQCADGPVTFPSATCGLDELDRDGLEQVGDTVVVHGYLENRRDASKTLSFVVLNSIDLRKQIQLVFSKARNGDQVGTAFEVLRSLETNSPVAVEATIQARKAPAGEAAVSQEKGRDEKIVPSVELKVTNLYPLNEFPQSIIMTKDAVFPPEQRHLQIRTDKSVRDALAFRSHAARLVREELCAGQGFLEIETPLLFKSTPEGAREFLVPTRAAGMAYALPQSPQQYKQILMASGIPKYMQIAKCFRDEDLRADRQLEFTQVDLEMAFASGANVMAVVEDLVKKLWSKLLGVGDLPNPLPRLKYEEAMSRYGSDKPDLRLGSEVSME